MVYCQKCGTLNADDASVCMKCGAPLHGAPQPDYGAYWRQRRYDHENYRYYHGGPGIGVLIFGLIIILIGLSVLFSEVYAINIPWFPIVIILVGLWLVFVAYRRSRHYSQPPPQP